MITEMAKIQVAMPLNLNEDVLKWLQEKELLHITNTNKDSKSVEGDADLDLTLAQLQYVLEFSEQIKSELGIEKKKSWRNIFSGKPIATLASLEQVTDNLKLEEIIKETKDISDKLTNLESKNENIKEKMERLRPWKNLEITGTDLDGTENVVYALIYVNAAEEALVKQKINKIDTAAQTEIFREVEKKRGYVYLEVMIHKQDAHLIEDIISQTSAEKAAIQLPYDSSISERFEMLDEEKIKNNQERRRLLKRARKITRVEKEVKFAYDTLLHRKERLLARQKMVDFNLSSVVTGWLPKNKLEILKEEAEKDFPSICIDEIKPAKSEQGPVVLQNTSFMSPFEAVTDIFGRPKYTEIDPTPALSFFFLIAFGLALTDAGYGLVMMGVMWVAERMFRLKKNMKKMVRLLFYAGVATVVFGAITGGWFGVNLENLPPSNGKSFLLSMKLIDPVTEPMNLLLVAFGIGVAQLLFAWVVRGYDHWRKGDIVAVVFDDAAWITMVISILLWVGSSRGILPIAWSLTLKMVVIVNALILVLTQGRSYRNPLLKIGGGIISLYGLVGFISDTLSYSRLLALGLATGIIALVVNLMGAMAADSLPGFGWVIAVFVLLVGHVFNIGINSLGAFIHSGRLQFVEFFPKFIEGGGKPFKPLGRVSKFVDNPNDYI